MENVGMFFGHLVHFTSLWNVLLHLWSFWYVVQRLSTLTSDLGYCDYLTQEQLWLSEAS
jgi:hypothetical protein